MPNPPTIDEMAESLSTSDLRREARRLFFEDSDRDAITLDYIMEFWPVYRIALEEHLKELGQGDVVWPELGSELELGVRVPGGFDGIEEVEVERDLRRRYAVMIINESLPEQLQGIVRTGDGLAEEWRKLDGFLSSYRACRDVLREDDPKNSVRLGSTPLPWWLQGASCFRLRTVDNLYDSRMSIWQLTSLLAIYTSVVGFLVLVLALLLRAEYFKARYSFPKGDTMLTIHRCISVASGPP